MTMAVVACRLELGLFLLYRVLKRGRDARFDEMRGQCTRFLGFWIYQIFWVYLVSLPVMFVNADPASPEWGAADTAGLTMWAVGFVVQVAADFEKARFRGDPANRGK